MKVVLTILICCFLLAGQAQSSFSQEEKIEQVILNIKEKTLKGEAAIKNLENYRQWGEEQTCNDLSIQISHYLGILYYRERQFGKVSKEWQISLAKRKELLPSNHYDIANNLFNLGVIFKKFNQFDKAIDYLNQCLATNNNEKNIQAKVLQEKGRIYEEIGDLKQALYHYQLSLEKFNPENDKRLIALTQIDIGLTLNTFQDSLSSQKALSYFHEALTYFQLVNDSRNIAVCHNGIASAHKHMNQYDKAEKYYQKAVGYYEKEEDKSQLARALNNWGIIFIRKGAFAEAESVLLEALNLALSEKEFSIAASASENLGDCYVAKNELEQALPFYQSAIQYTVAGFEENNPQLNPDLSASNQWIRSKTDLLIHLNSKAACFKKIGDTAGDVVALQSALNTYRTSDSLLHLIKKDMITEDARLFWQTKGALTWEMAAETAWQLYEQTTHVQYLHDIWTFSERSKSSLLLNANNDSQAQLQILPKALNILENKIKHQLGYYETIVAKQRLQQANNTEQILDSLLHYQSIYLDFVWQLETEYPRYYDLKYNDEIISIPVLQGELESKNTAFISYLFVNGFLYVFTITGQEYKVQKLDKPTDFAHQTQALLQSVKQPGGYQAYIHSAHYLFQQILEPALSQLDHTIDKLILVRDDQLQYIPFEMLLSQPASSEIVQYSQLDYLLNDYQVTYANSATLFSKQKRQIQPDKSQPFVGFAPYFANLLFNIQSLEEINKIIGGLIFTKEAANKDRLLAINSPVKVLHLSTHAKMNDQNPLENEIELAQETVLSTSEIYNLPFQTELVVLSACETGTGQLTKGEGLLSLGRAFMYSGCPSVVASLWQVEDESTSILMQHFYENLKKGLPKDAALHLAKKTYLEEYTGGQEMKYHPYHWSAFILMGNTQPVFTVSSFWKVLGLCGLGLGLCFIAYFSLNVEH